MENRMSQPQAMTVHAACPARDADWIEQRIIRAYVQLALEPDDTDGSRTVTLTGLGSLDVRLTEVPHAEKTCLAPFWLELRSWATGATIDSLGCYKFDEDELSAAVTFIQESTHRMRSLH
jgi:hypothetical protein